MRPQNLLFAFLSAAAFGGLYACGSESNSPGNGSGGAPSAGGSGGAAAGTAPQAGALAGPAGAPGIAGSSAGMSGGIAGSSGASGASGGAPAGGQSSGGAPSGGAAGSATAGSENGGTSAGSAGTAGSAGATGAAGGSGGGAHANMNFFVTSDTSKTANLGGLAKADERCQNLAAVVGAGDKVWKAYLSVENPATNARDRIGPGPYFNSKGEQLAATKEELHSKPGNAQLFLDEKGNTIDGQWNSAGNDNQHDILTGSKNDGTLEAGKTCGDWTSTTGQSQVGHHDGLGPNMNANAPYLYWAGAHTGQCGDTAPGGGAGRIYCFVAPP